MEKIRSGQSFLYRDGGLNSTVIDIRMKQNVRGDFLQRALTIALERYPYFMGKLVEKGGDFFLEECVNAMTVVKTDKFRVLGSMSTGYHLLDITYTGNSVRVAFHHALCDGRGIKPFVETLIYYYCSLRYNKALDSAGIRLAGEALLPGETQEPVGDALFEVDEANLPQVAKEGYHLPENSEDCEEYFRYEFGIRCDSFLSYMKACGATPAILLSLLVSESIGAVHPDAKLPIVCSMAIDFRNEIGLPNTHKNCVASVYLPFTGETRAMEDSERARLYRGILAEQRTQDAIHSLANKQIGLCHQLDQLPTLEAKREALSFFNDMCTDTYVISYLGQMELGGCEKYVDSIHLYNSGVKGLRINMIAAGECFAVDFLQNFTSDKIVRALAKALDARDMEYTLSEAIPFATVKDKAFITAGRQAERYFKKPL